MTPSPAVDPEQAALAKFGGKIDPSPHADPEAEAIARFGGTVGDSQQETQGKSGFHPLDEIGHGIHEFWNQVNPITAANGINSAIHDPAGAAKQMGQQNVDLWNKAKSAYDSGDYLGAIRHGVNYALNGIPGVGSAIDSAGDKFASGDVSGGVGQSLGIGANLAAPAVVPKITKAVGAGLKSAAVPVAESALGIKAIQRAYGKTPGQAVLEETKGIKPSTVAASARNKMADLNTQLETAAANAQGPASLTPARNVIDTRAATAAAGNSAATPAELAEMRAQLTQPRPGFAGVVDPATGDIAADQSPANILRMKREFGKDFTKFNPLHPKGEMGTARQVYRALDDELDRTVPGAPDLNQRISSLIPAAERAEETDLHAGIGQRLMHRAAAHTGALIGADAGYRAGGIPGAVAGFVLPEVAASPAGRMAAARTIYGTGKAVGSNAAGSAAQAGTVAAQMGRQIRDSIDGQR